MVRIVTEFVPKPSVLILCDNPHCAMTTSVDLDMGKDVQGQMDGIVKSAISLLGWSIGVMGTICPHHVKKAKEAQVGLSLPSAEETSRLLNHNGRKM